jgi:large subunit ribosomal protein L29
MSVKSIEVTELRDMDRDELWTQLDNARRELVSLRFQQATGQIDDHSKLGRARRRAARIMTIIREAELEEDGLLDHRSVQIRWSEPFDSAGGGVTSSKTTSSKKSADEDSSVDEGGDGVQEGNSEATTGDDAGTVGEDDDARISAGADGDESADDATGEATGEIADADAEGSDGEGSDGEEGAQL